MSNLIWKMPDQKPERNEDILVEYTSTNGQSYYIVDSLLNKLLQPKRWAYLSDIVAQADKAERLQKAVDIANEALKYARQRGLDNTATLFAVGTKADKALDEIRQLIKEKPMTSNLKCPFCQQELCQDYTGVKINGTWAYAADLTRHLIDLKDLLRTLLYELNAEASTSEDYATRKKAELLCEMIKLKLYGGKNDKKN